MGKRRTLDEIVNDLSDTVMSSYFQESNNVPVVRKRRGDPFNINATSEKLSTSTKTSDPEDHEYISVRKSLMSKRAKGSCTVNVTHSSQVQNIRFVRSFYDVECVSLAKSLLGQILVRRLDGGRLLKGKIVETECYLGGEDAASHSYRGRMTERNKPMYMAPGTTYVYFTYGMYHCFNISSRGDGAAVLLRSLEPIEGQEYMENLRRKRLKSLNTKTFKPHELCNGPSKLCISFNIDKETCNEKDLATWDGMWIEEGVHIEDSNIVVSHRIGIESVGGEWAVKPLRFYVLGNSSVSKRDKKAECALSSSNEATV